MVKKITHLELAKLVKIHYNKKIPLMCLGGFGIGKSDVIREVSKEIAKEKKKDFIDWNKISAKQKKELIGKTDDKFIFCDIRATQIEPSDLRGLPKFNGETDYVDWKPNLIFSLLSDSKADGIIFFDEMNNASPMVMASLYQIFLDRAIGEISFSKEIGIISAGNRVGLDKSNVFEIPSPLKDRMSEVELLTPNIERWSDWGFEKGIDGRIIAFLNFKPSRLYNIDDKSANKSSTPRGWFRCSELIKDVSDLDEVELISSSTIGEGVAIEFNAFLKLQRKIDIKHILDNPKEVREFKEIDLKYSLISTANEYYKTNKNVKVLEKIFGVCEYFETEFSVLLLRMCKSIDEEFFRKEAVKIKSADKILKGYAKYLIM